MHSCYLEQDFKYYSGIPTIETSLLLTQMPNVEPRKGYYFKSPHEAEFYPSNYFQLIYQK